MPRTRVLWIALPLLALDLAAAGLVIDDPTLLVVCIVAGGLVLGVLNTVLTECVMEATDLQRSVASSAYSAVRFLGGAIAPPAAAELARLISPEAPYFAAAGSVLVALARGARRPPRPAPRRRCARAGARRGGGDRGRRRGLRHPSAVSRYDRSARRARGGAHDQSGRQRGARVGQRVGRRLVEEAQHHVDGEPTLLARVLLDRS